ncbi:4-alpha-glucanotransferase [Fimbriiglobus ruber]|uniref:4-alpha-glucanotransferase n=1 Tax=Fimbriiglobus ruber TaxID=1908690 RepID=A0A225DNC6_9BACT|nr:4-alpha-glucanotransferase [Fimbriiglobus ruber]OWK37687.1 4-alpha-glucanotransferase [Fimbriiglobus ruber]
MPAPASLVRSSGVLLHPTSLPGPFGIGDLGPEAYRWVETLAAARQSWWQILPLNPTGVGGSPYQSFSAFAGNINLLSPEQLVRDGLLATATVRGGEAFPTTRVDFPRVAPYKEGLLREAWGQFRGWKGPHGLREAFEEYCRREASWLDDYALFMAIRAGLGGAGLSHWPDDLRRRQPAALAAVQQQSADEVAMHRFGQFLFDRQWCELKRYATDRAVRIIGDAPIFVSGDSADVWAHPDLFLLDHAGNPKVVAGVPPDYFSATGQHWGNPLYDWDRMAQSGYAWWVARLRRNLTNVDLIRLDHFRGFAAAWHIPAADKNAMNGRWVDGPRYKLFDRLAAELGKLPLIAEDLGLITPDVHELREQFAMPGMRVLQFALGGPDNPYWPHNYEPLTVAYTGTHDNDTTVGWYAGLTDKDHQTITDYIGHHADNPAWDLIRLAWSSVAVLAIAPLQDVLELGGDARMNVPGVADGNWRWRYRPDQVRPAAFERLAEWTTRYNRVPRK